MTRPLIAAALALAVAVPLHASAQDYPSKPIRVMHPYAPGGPAELLTRSVTEQASKALGQPFVIESRPGAAGNIGAEQLVRSAPDGYSLLTSVFFTVAANPHLYANMPFDPLKDLVPVIGLARFDSALIVHPSIAANNLREFIAHVKANPGKLNFASAGKGSPGHVLAEVFSLRAGLNMVHVPYKGNGPAVQAVAAGEVAMMLTPTTVVTPLAKAGRVKLLAVYNTARNEDFPDVPTLEAQGLSGFEQKDLPVWYGIFAPAGTPPAIVAKLNGAFNAVLGNPETAGMLGKRGFIIIGGTAQEFGELVRHSHAAWGKAIREAGIKGE